MNVTSMGAARPRRRSRDRLTGRESQLKHGGRAEVANLLLLIDDDLQETADAMGAIEGFLADAQGLLDGDELRPEALLRLCAADDVMTRIDTLGETLAMLRRRFGALAATIG